MMIRNVLDFLSNTSNKYPDKIFIADEKKSISFSEAETIAKSIGSFLAEEISTRNHPIAVCVDRDVESVLMFLGVAYSGNFYVPINKALPADRIKVMLDALQPEAVLGLAEDRAQMEGFSCPFYEFGEAGKAEVREDALALIRRDAIDTDPLYAIFTSGSTGTPKAVMVSHRSVIDLAYAYRDAFDITAESICGNQASFDFDVSVKDVYSSLLNGCTVHIIPKDRFSFPVKLIAYLNEKKITHCFWAVATLCLVANLNGMKHEIPKYLKHVVFGGEVIPIKVLNYWMEHLLETRFYNGYGPTEITVNCTYFPVRHQYELDEAVPIGRPFPNTGVLVLDEHDKPVSGDGVGELCVRGTCLALGYYNNPEKTAEVFVQNPLNTSYPEKIYRTGDLVKYDNEGQIVFCGRKDFQIKHMGYRIELGDIETAANALDFVGRTCCSYDKVNKRIVLFYEATEKLDKIVRDALKSKLPKYMIPGKYMQIPAFPENVHGKIDRKKLERLYVSEI